MSADKPNKGRGKVIGRYPSLKTGRMEPYQSTIEEDLIYMLDFSESVRHFEMQPLTIEYWWEGKLHQYTPDALVGLARRNLLVECKPHSQAVSPTAENLRKWEAARRYCADYQWEFHIITDLQLRQGNRLRNVKLLTRYARHIVAPPVQARIFSLLSGVAPDRYPITIAQLAGGIASGDFQSAISSVLHMVYAHKLCVMLDDEQLTPSSPIWLPNSTPPALPTLLMSSSFTPSTQSTSSVRSRKLSTSRIRIAPTVSTAPTASTEAIARNLQIPPLPF